MQARSRSFTGVAFLHPCFIYTMENMPVFYRAGHAGRVFTVQQGMWYVEIFSRAVLRILCCWALQMPVWLLGVTSHS